jgi:hypothetical protein
MNIQVMNRSMDNQVQTSGAAQAGRGLAGVRRDGGAARRWEEAAQQRGQQRGGAAGAPRGRTTRGLRYAEGGAAQ